MIGYGYGNGAENTGCKDGPSSLGELNLSTILSSSETTQQLDAIPEIARLSAELAALTSSAVKQHQPFTVIGGDNTCSIGTWSGAASAIEGPLGLIWLDAHMDSHTVETSPSNNVHGMPLACLLSYGDERLTTIMRDTPKLLPEHTCLVGVRSFEPGEAELLKLLNIRVFYADEVHKRGLSAVMKDAIGIAKQGTAGFGFCLDLDVIDPVDAPGVGTPEPNGLHGDEVITCLKGISEDKQFLGCEICEFNPHEDKENKTQRLIVDLLGAIF